MANHIIKRPKRSELIYLYFANNLKQYLQQTTLHGLKYLADSSLSIWEKLFFFTTFAAAFTIVVNLISNVYAAWDSTPVIIGMSPHATSILTVPFPALTFCNMNQVLKSKVTNYSEDSLEFDMLRYICYTGTEYENMTENGKRKNSHLIAGEFVIKHAPPCSKFLLHCEINSIAYNCSNLFREKLTDEGLCCEFNGLHPKFLYRGRHMADSLAVDNTTTAVNWNPESGYPKKLPEKFYPRPAAGTGISRGVTVILNADIDEYYCSSANGPGIKVSVHNPIESPSIRDTGLTIPLGYETRFRISAAKSEAVSAIRSIHRKRRQCVFAKEKRLLFYKHYTRRNCEKECFAEFLYQRCNCLSSKLPTIYSNASACTVNDILCIKRANQQWTLVFSENTCLIECLPSCTDLTFRPDCFSSQLAKSNYTIRKKFLQNLAKNELRRNIAVAHFYYRESVFYGDVRNVYIGFTEFLSNIGGIMGLFMGFSFISISEIIYYVILQPVTQFLMPKKWSNFLVNKNRHDFSFN